MFMRGNDGRLPLSLQYLNGKAAYYEAPIRPVFIKGNGVRRPLLQHSLASSARGA
jgi:hypothetical protein